MNLFYRLRETKAAVQDLTRNSAACKHAG